MAAPTPSARPPAPGLPRFLGPLKALLFVAALLPLARAAWIVATGQAVNPIEFITRSTGTWTLTFLLITLAVSPLKRLTGLGWLLKLRRMAGLYAYFYGVLHLTTYLWLDKFFELHAIAKDIYKRPFITVGFAAIVLMTPLAVTSTQGWMKRLKRNWGKLHKLVYPVAILGVLHYWWLVKKDVSQPALYATILAILLAERLIRRWAEQAKQRRLATPASKAA
ncbi:protein-methionine-sulfoxide reductase heme-binding subunit MsrQ [Crenobacter sp. SG2305]|uniref:sulfite oxidase heme-binding subunit YedZ n=1 Tax=Crenobacter oryzisoli TaxID=3056844 RepID=UPI0025AA7567|nr:protein-methionine-sulfoxide reductase heme-binding subunit MsrQ [Crenobacter sp. SG2305]MDN0084129.1 protein-methionine-sulfoxide reductase heme-binding subunit MsrQ [Crenobacter sp. SG2305]